MKVQEIVSSMFPVDATGKVFGRYRINDGSSLDFRISAYITNRRPLAYGDIPARCKVKIETYLNLAFSFHMDKYGEYETTIGEFYAKMYFFNQIVAGSAECNYHLDTFIYYGLSKFVNPKLRLAKNFEKQFPAKSPAFAGELKKYVKRRKSRLERESYEKRISDLEAKLKQNKPAGTTVYEFIGTDERIHTIVKNGEIIYS